MGSVVNGFIKVLFLVFLQNSSTSSGRTSFSNACRLDSECVNLKDCKPFMNLTLNTQKPLHPTIFKFLNSQLCGFTDNSPKVCCSQIPSDVERLQQLTNLNSTPAAKFPSSDKIECQSPLKCMRLSDCKSVTDHQQTVSLQRCDLHFNYLKICCLENRENSKIAPIPTEIGQLEEKTTHPKISLSDKAEAINRLFSIHDFIDVMAFDLMRRRRNGNSEVDIEIR